jgi:hypothetical protein
MKRRSKFTRVITRNIERFDAKVVVAEPKTGFQRKQLTHYRAQLLVERKLRLQNCIDEG